MSDSTRRRIDLCTCGKPRLDIVHTLHIGGYANAHAFMPNPQPPPLPDPAAFHRIHALRLNGVWVAEVYGSGPFPRMGRGQAVQWLDAVNAALEDLKEKT